MKTRALLVVCAVLALGGSAQALRLPSAPRCPVFPASNPWNQRVDRLPVAADSDAIIGSIGRTDHVHADFGSGLWNGGPIGIPITVVRGTQPKVRVRFEYADESDRGPYPIPRNVRIEGGRAAEAGRQSPSVFDRSLPTDARAEPARPDGRRRRVGASDGDRHAIIVDRDRCRLYELFALYPTAGGGWSAGSGAIWNLRSNRLRPAGWTSADAAGLPILPGLARYDEVARGRIDHALRFTVRQTRRAYIHPARHFASDATDRALPPMGLRVRLKGGFDTRSFPRQARIVLDGLKRFGMIVSDNGSDWYITGAPDPRWSNEQLHTLHRVPGSAFEVVDTTSLRP